MRFIVAAPLCLLVLTCLLSGGCGVKGDPTPYIDVYPEKKAAQTPRPPNDTDGQKVKNPVKK